MGPEAAKAFAEFLASQGLCFNRKGDIVPMESPKAGVIKPGDVPEKLRIKANNLLDENGNVVKWENQAMSDEQLIPNAVGRLDDVVEALRDGDWQKAFGLLHKRDKDVRAKADNYDRLSKSAKDEMGEILRFMDRCAEDDGFRERVRVACGGGAEVKSDE